MIQFMGNKVSIGLDEALALTAKSIETLTTEWVELQDGAERIVASDICARVDSPSIDASLKDGFGVVSGDVHQATPQSPVMLQLAGSVAAGDARSVSIESGSAIRVLTGAKIPQGCDAVVAEEFTRVSNGRVEVRIDAAPGRNILPRGCDVQKGGVVVEKGSRIGPGTLGLLAAAGHNRIEVVRRPEIALLATGDEIVAPGRPLPEGKLYASNIITLSAWCKRYGFKPHLQIVPDDPARIEEALLHGFSSCDAVLTSGGAWTGDRDLVAKILDRLGWQKLFHRIRIGPGKAVGCGLVDKKPVFILPGGPPSNLMGFLQIALPGLLQRAGSSETGLPEMPVKVERELDGRHLDWTQFIFGTLTPVPDSDHPLFRPMSRGSRLRSMAEARAIVKIPEGQTLLPAGSVVSAQILG
ncbi:gephyrin-like molybdotransferase Glp [Desulfopila sp. IMCC35008]|uniref:molybdopterin molybdotransferase MoeA n=1 Tax=Desulfopila sp. IMCC35008 TaxID=2653858 RepID=UPI001F0CE895|nr:gephyrin-like molybdotransferase Glp [Desulfopila sp. IMCC35008]